MGIKSKGLGASCFRVTLCRIFLVIHLPQDIGANLIPRSQCLFYRCEQLEPGDLAYLLQHFIRRRGKFGIVHFRLTSCRRRRRSLLRTERGSANEARRTQQQYTEAGIDFSSR